MICNTLSNNRGGLYTMDSLDKAMMHFLAGMEQMHRFHHATQNGVQFKTCELFLSGIFHLIFLDMVDQGN